MSGIYNLWYTIGECLRVEKTDLDSLSSHNSSCFFKLSEVLQLWMDRKTKPVTWNTILEVIGSPPIQNKFIVMEIEIFLQCEYIIPIKKGNCTFVKFGICGLT